MNSLDKQYLQSLETILNTGNKRGDRTGTGTISIFDYTIDHNIQEGFPLLTTKRVWFKGVLHELLWFLSGDMNIKYLVKNNVNIWNDWPYKKYTENVANPLSMEEYVKKIIEDDDFAKQYGDVGRIYGAQWLNWTDTTERVNGDETIRKRIGLNQIDNLIHTLKTNPEDRRMIVTAWNPAEIKEAALPSCHYNFQCYSEELTDQERVNIINERFNNKCKVNPETLQDLEAFGIPKRKLSLKWAGRSIDSFLGGPFDIASYGLFLIMLAQVTNHIPHRLISTFGDYHIYMNHINQVKQQLQNEGHDLPIVKINPDIKSIYDFKYKDFELINYKHDGTIKAPISV